MDLKNLFTIIFLIFSITINSQSIRINEVVASNSTIFDEDGDTPDWIELYNYGSEAISLNNWNISDEENDDEPWVFPEISLLADEYLLIWASSKDRSEINYIRTHVNHGDEFKYIVPNGNIQYWNTLGFNDESWDVGLSSFGYGDNDDETQLPFGTISVYLRKQFSIDDASLIQGLILDVDYDDGFVAYINGVEIARANINGSPPSYNATTPAEHEALIYDGGIPVRYSIDNPQDFLVDGENILSIQAHNISDESSDLTIIPFLSAVYSDSTDEGIIPPEILDLSPVSFMHTNFKISSSGETIYLRDPSNNLVDSVTIENLSADVSYGVSMNSNELVYFDIPTPEGENNSEEFLGVLISEVIFSHNAGILESPISLVLEAGEDEYIRYTKDRTEPNALSYLYEGPIEINVNSVIRAKSFKDSYISSYSYTRTYLFNVSHEIPFVSLVTDPYNLFDDDYGIYVYGDEYNPAYPHFGANFWEDWERPIHFSLYNEDGTLAANYNAGVKIFGGWSRGQDQRSLSIFARGGYGVSEFEYQFFEDINYDEFQSLVLRNSGNDWLRSNIRDVATTSLMEGSGLDYQKYTSVASYINGDYWGIYHMREKTSENMLASKHNVNANEIDLLELNAEIVDGDNQEYIELRNFVEENDLSIQSNYEYVKNEIDINNFIMYNVAQIYIDNRDWPGNNIKYWKHPEGKWRWILYDTDFGFSGQWWSSWDLDYAYSYNTLEFALDSNGPSWPNPPWSTLMFRRLVENIEFRNKFINRYADEMNSRFLPDRVIDHFTNIYDSILSEIPNHLDRWNSGMSSSDIYFYVDKMNNFAANRQPEAKQHILEEFNLPDYHKVSILNQTPTYGYVRLNNNLIIQEEDWEGDYFEEVPITLKAVAESGYEFSHWSGESDSTDSEIELSISEYSEIQAHFIPGSEVNIVINEINYKSSDEFDTGDWIELYNPNSSSIDLSSWVFKDNNDSNTYIIPEGTTIQEDSYLVIVKDEDDFLDYFPEITNIIGEFDFGLSSSSDGVRIFNSDGVLQDEVNYLSSDPWPDLSNGGGYTLELISPNLDNSLPESWSNINLHGSPDQVNTSTASITDLDLANSIIFPNPFNNEINVFLNLNKTSNVQVSMFDIKGVKIIDIFKGDLDSGMQSINSKLDRLSSGLYMLKITTSDGITNIYKLIKR